MGTDQVAGRDRTAGVTIVVAAIAVLLLVVAVVTLVGGGSTDSDPTSVAPTASEGQGADTASTTPRVLDAAVLDDLVPDGADEVERGGTDAEGFRSVTFRVDGSADDVVAAVGAVLREDDWVLRQRDTVGTTSRAVYDAEDARVLSVDVVERPEGVRVAVVLTGP